MPERESVLIAGAGYLGNALARQLIAASYDVSILRRRAIGLPGAQLICADLLNPKRLTGLPSCSHLVYCVAADHGSEEAYRDAYFVGLQNLIAAFRRQGCFPHVIFSSSTSVYQEAQGGWVDEGDLRLVDKGPSRYMVEAERYLATYEGKASILRFGGIYGPERTYFLRRVKEKVECLWDGPAMYTNRIHRDDCVGIMQMLIERPEARGVIYNAVDCDPAERNVVLQWMSQLLGVDLGTLERTNDPKRIAHRGNKRVQNRRLLSEGYQFHFPSFREGYLDLVREVGV